MAGTDQFLRKATLIVSGKSGSGLDLSQFRITFRVQQSDFETPNNAEITIYNLAQNTAQQIRNEFTSVALQAGYQTGNFGIIFNGTIKQAKIGRENATDTTLKIIAAESDLAYNFGVVNTNVPAGTSMTAQAQIIAKAAGLQADASQINFAVGYNQANIRGKVLYGMARTYLRNLARSGLSRWSIQKGAVKITPLSGYSDTQAVVINSQTGMIGLPEQTQDGISVVCLLNPKIVPGTQVQINESSIQRASVSVNPADINQVEAAFPAISGDGFYTVLVAEHEGDTRGNPWYSTLTCLAVDKTQPTNNAVKPFG